LLRQKQDRKSPQPVDWTDWAMQKATVYKTVFKEDSYIKNFADPAYKAEDDEN
jgi:hypothetical protein